MHYAKTKRRRKIEVKVTRAKLNVTSRTEYVLKQPPRSSTKK